MKKAAWRKHHKITGIALCFFMMMFSISGIILNHRHIYTDVNVSRSLLPSRYEYNNWNNGLLRGTLVLGDTVLVYGGGGIWQTDSRASYFVDFNDGLPESADVRNIRSVVRTTSGKLFACSRFGLFVKHSLDSKWKESSFNALIPKGKSSSDLSDITLHGDSLIIVSRSHLYVSLPPYKDFQKIEVQRTADYDGKVSLFRTFWLLHSGEIYGTATRILVDMMGIIMFILSFTGILYFLLGEHLKRINKNKKVLVDIPKKHVSSTMRFNLKWHNRIGKWTIALTLFVAFTGWCLRPPMLVALSKIRVPGLPGSELAASNMWNDRLRMIRWDENSNDWLLSTADGFFSLSTLDSQPKPVLDAPPVSVMGLNAFLSHNNTWFIGSFSGLYEWKRHEGEYKDINTDIVTKARGEITKVGPPIGGFFSSGISMDFQQGPVFCEYVRGTDVISQPEVLSKLPMSLWAVSLELHNGRLYPFCGGIGSMFFIFIIGIITLWCLLSGYKVHL